MQVSLGNLLHIADNFHQSMLEIRNYMFEACFQCYTLLQQLIRLQYFGGATNLKNLHLRDSLNLWVGLTENNKHKTSSMFGLHKWPTFSVL